MATTSSLGVGTGVDLQAMLGKLMDAENAPVRALDTKIAATNSKISLYGTLKGQLDTLQAAAQTLQFPSRLSALSASSSDSTVLGATAEYTATPGTYSFEVTQLASAQKTISMGYVAGTTFSGGDLNFKVGGVAAPTITLAAGSYTLEDIRSKINDAGTGVTATIINVGDGGQRMVLTGDKSGTANSFSLTSTLIPSDASGPPIVPQSSLASASADPTKGIVAKDATMLLDGIAVKSSTNQFTDTVKGLTLTAVKLGTSNVTVQNDSTKITAAVQAFVNTYNTIATTIKTNSGYDAKTQTGQAFNGDASARSVLDTLGNIRTTVPPELSTATIKTLSELGISIQQTGLLSLDTAQLNKAISTSATDTIKALSAYGQSFSNSIMSMTSSGGAVGNRVNSLNTSLKAFQSNQDTLTLRVALIEKRYRAQFTALDTYMSKMQTTSSSLAQSLAGLPK